MRTDQERNQLLAELSLSQEALSFTRAQLLTAHTEGLANRDASERLHLIELEEARAQAEEARAQAEEARAQANQLGESLATSRTRLHELNTVLEVLQSENEDYKMKLLHTRDAVIGASAELGTMRARYEATESQVDSLVHQLNLLHTSRTWRIGRFVLLPLRAVRWMLRKLNS
jgi:chromosome segregation ATPase